MPYYLLVHKVEVFPESQDEWIDQWREVRKKAHGDIEWVHSFLDPAAGKLYCQWKAENMDSIVKCLPPDMQEQAPIEYSSEIILFDTLWLD
jgi:hypothetical protein